VPQPSSEVRDAELDDLETVRWRRAVLFNAGYEWDDAKALARTHVDLHEAVEFVKRPRITSALARQILS
jgi:hypothetical protein